MLDYYLLAVALGAVGSRAGGLMLWCVLAAMLDYWLMRLWLFGLRVLGLVG
jgi:hypothetical protein